MATSTSFCPHCGTPQLKPNARFCHYCGRPLPGQPAPPEAPQRVNPDPTRVRTRGRPRLLWVLGLLGLVSLLIIPGLTIDPLRNALATRFPGRLGRPLPTHADVSTDPLATSGVAARVTQQSPASAPQASQATITPEPTTAPLPTATPTLSPTPTPTAMPTLSPTPSPLPSQSPTATATATHVPTPTTPTCTLPLGTPFRATWQKYRALLGCPVDTAATTEAATERFQNGRMIWRQNNDMIYVLYTQRDWIEQADIFVDGSPEPGGFNPPAGLQVPVRGFGAIWREVLGGPSARLGWALEMEYGVFIQAQDFDNGVIVELEDVVYVLGDNGKRWLNP